MYYVYIIKWDKNHYIWYTSNLKKRFKEHLEWKTLTTKKMWNINLLWYFEKGTKTEAIKLENMIKRNWHVDHRINHKTFKRY